MERQTLVQHKKKENTRPGNIPVIRGLCFILTRYSILTHMGFPSTISVDPWYLIEFSSSLTIKTIPPRARGALKNEQVSGIVRDYK